MTPPLPSWPALRRSANTTLDELARWLRSAPPAADLEETAAELDDIQARLHAAALSVRVRASRSIDAQVVDLDQARGVRDLVDAGLLPPAAPGRPGKCPVDGQPMFSVAEWPVCPNETAEWHRAAAAKRGHPARAGRR